MTDMIQEAVHPPIQWTLNPHAAEVKDSAAVQRLLPQGAIEDVIDFHRQIPDYAVTSLHPLTRLAERLGLGSLWVKDESNRMGLNAFKSLGGSYAVYQFIRQQLGVDHLTYDELLSEFTRQRLGDITFTSATDGNHGKGLAWACERLGFPCVIYVHKDTTQARIDAIAAYGAEVRVVDGTYDDAVHQCSLDAEANGWQVISDTSWEGYEEIPAWVMQGYTTLLSEALDQMQQQGVQQPTHVVIQGGVGAFAAAVCSFFKRRYGYGDEAPKLVIVEPATAACLYHSAVVADGQPHTIGGELQTIMAGLACGEPSALAWGVLWDCADAFLAVPDYVGAKGMRVYGMPLSGDPAIVSGESGAVTLGALTFLMESPQYADLRQALDIDADSQVLLVSTEGDTDPEYYRYVVWEGGYAVPEQYAQRHRLDANDNHS